MTAQSRSPDDAERQSLVEFLVPSRRSSVPPAPSEEQAGAAKAEDSGANAGVVEARAPSPEPEEWPTPPDVPARSHIGSSLRPITVDPTPRPSLDDEERDIVSVLPPPTLRSLRRIAVRAAAVLAAGALVFGIRRAVTRKPAPAAQAPAVAAGPRVPEEPPAAPPEETDEDLDDPGIVPDVEAGQSAAREARRLLEAGKIQEGVAQARKAIFYNPADSQNYVLLAAGLQDLGKWQEARDIFSKCVHQPSGQRNAECVYFATHPGR
jgi:hypothetical protein